jgi:hypothetical protein
MFQRFYAQGTEAGLDLDIQVDPGKRVYCFFGRNGAGKTILLENLGRALLLAHVMFEDKAQAPAPSTTPDTTPALNASLQGVYNDAEVRSALNALKLRIPTEVHLDEAKIKTAAQKWGITDFENWKMLISDPWRSKGTRFVIDHPVIAISARDRGFTGNLASDRVRLLGSRAARFVQAFLRTYQAVTRQSVETESLAEWLIARLVVNPAFSRSDDRSFEVEVVLRLMEELDPPTFGGITSKSSEGALQAISYVDGQLWLGRTPLDKLPSGFISIIKLFQEILGGYAGWTAFTQEKRLADLEGIVLIDELEAHLHPTWQARILPLLKRFFPRTTFIVCTHSPLIVATTEEGEAYELVRENNKVTAAKLGNPRAWYLADVYEQAFHVDLPPSDDSANVPDLLLDFSIKVKDHLRTKEPAIKAEAEALYERIVPSVPSTDPRRASLDALKGMLQ